MCEAYGKRMMFMALPFITGAIIDVFNQGIVCFDFVGNMVCYVCFIT